MATETIQAQFDKWNDALQTGDPDQVTALYAEDAVLLPTVSNKVRHNHEEIRDYFVSFLKKQPKGTINESNVREFSDDLALNAGTYAFAVVQDGKPGEVPARFSFLYRKDASGDWKIVEHHSSAMPE